MIGDRDANASDRASKRIIKEAENVPPNRKLFVRALSDDHGFPVLSATLSSPGAAKPAYDAAQIKIPPDPPRDPKAPRERSQWRWSADMSLTGEQTVLANQLIAGATDALDYMGYWKALDMALQAAFSGKDAAALKDDPGLRRHGALERRLAGEASRGRDAAHRRLAAAGAAEDLGAEPDAGAEQEAALSPAQPIRGDRRSLSRGREASRPSTRVRLLACESPDAASSPARPRSASPAVPSRPPKSTSRSSARAPPVLPPRRSSARPGAASSCSRRARASAGAPTPTTRWASPSTPARSTSTGPSAIRGRRSPTNLRFRLRKMPPAAYRSCSRTGCACPTTSGRAGAAPSRASGRRSRPASRPTAPLPMPSRAPRPRSSAPPAASPSSRSARIRSASRSPTTTSSGPATIISSPAATARS